MKRRCQHRAGASDRRIVTITIDSPFVEESTIKPPNSTQKTEKGPTSKIVVMKMRRRQEGFKKLETKSQTGCRKWIDGLEGDDVFTRRVKHTEMMKWWSTEGRVTRETRPSRSTTSEQLPARLAVEFGARRPLRSRSKQTAPGCAQTCDRSIRSESALSRCIQSDNHSVDQVLVIFYLV